MTVLYLAPLVRNFNGAFFMKLSILFSNRNYEQGHEFYRYCRDVICCQMLSVDYGQVNVMQMIITSDQISNDPEKLFSVKLANAVSAEVTILFEPDLSGLKNFVEILKVRNEG